MPLSKNLFDRIGDIFEFGEVSVVGGQSAGEFPDALDGVEVRAIAREKLEGEARGVCCAPILVQSGMVVLGVIGDECQSALNINPRPASITSDHLPTWR